MTPSPIRLPLLPGWIALLAVAACGGAPRPAESSAPAIPWDAMTAPQREAYMRSAVLPRMKAVFMEFDPHRYPRMDCVPCHPADRATHGWKMPNPDLLLDPACAGGAGEGAHGPASYADAAAKMSAFMRDRVQPEMAALLGRPEEDPTTRRGFGCFGCHTPERPSPAPAP